MAKIKTNNQVEVDKYLNKNKITIIIVNSLLTLNTGSNNYLALLFIEKIDLNI